MDRRSRLAASRNRKPRLKASPAAVKRRTVALETHVKLDTGGDLERKAVRLRVGRRDAVDDLEGSEGLDGALGRRAGGAFALREEDERLGRLVARVEEEDGGLFALVQRACWACTVLN